MSEEEKEHTPSMKLKNGGTPERAIQLAKLELKVRERTLDDYVGTKYEAEHRELIEHFKNEIKYWEEKLVADPVSNAQANNEDEDDE